jgi:hypothetical protein
VTHLHLSDIAIRLVDKFSLSGLVESVTLVALVIQAGGAFHV